MVFVCPVRFIHSGVQALLHLETGMIADMLALGGSRLVTAARSTERTRTTPLSGLTEERDA
ncbi:hypothetical protein AB0J89_03715 [Micromonospora chokoriensis]